MLNADMNATPKLSICGKLTTGSTFLHPTRVLNTFVLMIGYAHELYLEQGKQKNVLTANRYILNFPGVRHGGFKPSEPGTSYYWVHFTLPDNSFSMLENESGPLEPNRLILPETSVITSRSAVYTIVNQLMDLSAANTPYSQEVCSHLISALLLLLATDASKPVTRMPHSDASIDKIREWVDDHATQNLSVVELAQMFNYNPDYLSHKFRLQTGDSLIRYINRAKINASIEMLRGSQLTINEISYRCGFQTPKYFARLFKEYEGVTPSQYRHQLGQEER